MTNDELLEWCEKSLGGDVRAEYTVLLFEEKQKRVDSGLLEA